MTEPSKAEELLEIAEKRNGTDAMQILVEKHFDSVMALRQELAIDGTELLSSNIATDKRVDRAVRDHITSLQRKMQALIEEVAQRIENHNYRSAEEAIAGIRSLKEKERSSRLIAADKRTHVSCQSLKVAVDVLQDLNKQILNKLEAPIPPLPSDEESLLLGNALLVYELTDFAIKFIEGFRLHGIDEIEAIYKEMQKRMAELREEAKALRKQADFPDIEENVREQVMRDINARDESRTILETAWSEYMESVRSCEGGIANVTKKIPTLRLIRDNAKAQIDTIELVTVLRIVKNNVSAIEATVQQLERIQLATLSPDRVKRLLGINRS